MIRAPQATASSELRIRLRGAGVAALGLILLLTFAASAPAATSVGLGTADSFGVLSGAGVTNTGPSVVNGDLGTSPNPSVTGFGGPPNGTVNGAIHQADAVAGQAKDDLVTAYNDAAGQGPANTLATELGGQTLAPGVYNSSSGTFGITGQLTLDANGNPDAVFVFQTASTLISASASQVNLINGAQACNVFWKVGSSATLGTDSDFAGNILALQSISLNSGVTVDGRLLARNGAVSLINDTITRAECAGGGGVPPPPGGGGVPPPPGGGGGGGTGGGGPTAKIIHVPKGHSSGPGPRCTDRGFRAEIRVRGTSKVRRVNVFLDGNLIVRRSSKQFSFWVKVRGLRSGRHTLRVVAIDSNGRRDSDSRRFRRCAPAAPSPIFTG